MSRYNHYAQDLQTAFISARDQYAEAYNTLQAAKSAANRADKNTVEGQRLMLMYAVAEKDFEAAEKTIWAEFDKTHERLTADLSEEVKRDSLVNPGDIDKNALELLKSGVMRGDDFVSMWQQFSENNTMLRLIGSYAEKQDDPKARAVAFDCKNGVNSVLTAWNTLGEATKYCSGRSRPYQKERPEFIVAAGTWWEKTEVPEAVEAF